MKEKFDKKSMQGIQVNSLTWHAQKEEKVILQKINCTLEKGYIYGLIGPNGSGKTSLAKNILRFIKAQEGEIELDGKELEAYKRQDLAKKIALVPQNTRLDSNFSSYDIVMMGRTPYQKRFADASNTDQEAVKHAMILTDCYDLKDKNVVNLSGGEAQRVVTARAIAQDTQWLILDEPTSSLDIKHQIELMDALVRLNKAKNISVIAILHDINMAAAYCNRIIMMKEGKLHSMGKTEEVLTIKNLEEVYGVGFDLMVNPRTGKNYYMAYQQAEKNRE